MPFKEKVTNSSEVAFSSMGEGLLGYLEMVVDRVVAVFRKGRQNCKFFVMFSQLLMQFLALGN